MYTPGPWRVGERNGEIAVESAENGHRIGTMAWSSRDKLHLDDAKVVAAAPDMLAVCEALILTDDLQHAIDLARVVLGKLGKIARA